MYDKSVLDTITISVKNEALRIFAERLNKIILYGSYARGDYEATSDIDIMLLLDISTEALEKYRSDVAKVASRLSLENENCITVSIVLQDVDSFMKYKSISSFYNNVELEGVVVYAA